MRAADGAAPVHSAPEGPHMTRPICGSTLALLLAAAAVAQAPKDQPAPKAPAKAFALDLGGLPKLDDTSRYLARVAKLREMMKTAGAEAASGLNQVLAAEAAFVGRHHEALALMDAGRPEIPAAKNTDALDPYEPRDAAAAIA